MTEELAVTKPESEVAPVSDSEKIKELEAKVAMLTELVLRKSGAVEEQPQEKGPTNAEVIMAELLAPYEPWQIEAAEAWIIREIGSRRKVKRGPDDIAEIEFNRTEVTQAHRDAKITSAPVGWLMINNVPVPALAAYYIHIILDDTGTYASDDERVMGMILHSRSQGKGEKCLHPELEHLLTEDGVLRRKRGQHKSRRGKRD